MSEWAYICSKQWVSEPIYVPNHERVSLYMFQTMSEWAYISPSKEVEASMGQNIICWNVGTSNEENSKNQNTGTKRNGVFSTDQGSWSFDGSEHYFAKCWHQQWGKFKKSKYGHEAKWRIFHRSRKLKLRWVRTLFCEMLAPAMGEIQKKIKIRARSELAYFSTDQGSWSFDVSEHYFVKCWHQQWGKFKKNQNTGT